MFARIVGAPAGAFDVTVGPLVQLWRASRRTKQLPTAEELAAAKERVGYETFISMWRTWHGRTPTMPGCSSISAAS